MSVLAKLNGNTAFPGRAPHAFCPETASPATAYVASGPALILGGNACKWQLTDNPAQSTEACRIHYGGWFSHIPLQELDEILDLISIWRSENSGVAGKIVKLPWSHMADPSQLNQGILWLEYQWIFVSLAALWGKWYLGGQIWGTVCETPRRFDEKGDFISQGCLFGFLVPSSVSLEEWQRRDSVIKGPWWQQSESLRCQSWVSLKLGSVGHCVYFQRFERIVLFKTRLLPEVLHWDWEERSDEQIHGLL